MSALAAYNIVAMAVTGACVLVSAVCIDRAERVGGGWYHGSSANWRIVAALNAIAFALNGLSLAGAA